MVVFPNAKINIGLNIVEKRSDGFHNLTSCFYPVGWCDALEILPASAIRFESSGLPIPGDSTHNLCLKAYKLLAQEYSLPPVSIHLLKAVPIGAGLGGGSADAAFTIKALSEIFSLNLSVATQQDYARKLGSDCAFFIENKPNFCFGKGDEFEQIDVRLTGMHLVLVHPGIHISTAEAYAGIRPKQPAHDLQELLQQPIDQWRTGVVNDFEEALFSTYPLLPAIKTELYQQGAVYASMSGSGSTLYGIFREAPNLSNNFVDFTVWQGELT
ncbi:4-(cytidine 5'-diphospho)-2-C-methyl-D-erythritol kinase [Arundinibacter roseus]|uniref:4-diphosphocytidyl-2-C-methyl-D-erythritol kinase n=1 Tax=Arundinibacter roseus TaxID=2070510 RepID=A0A4R4JYA7_9BACT|nr:4-(cytidine 5'-diphospho)-2-C-methyl-D-erythritol kinase [Arundinibacter roseus]TDB59152.1 4-(cytidine 5'-diphospho)-2-C-methyl-D-erythritol kinase [Arundinibacter roseus]